MDKYSISFDYQVVALGELSEEHRLLIKKAREATKYSYSPYSNFTVGCSLLMKDGTIHSGANQENASYGATICGERSTIFSAYNKGYRGEITTIAVTGKMRSQQPGAEPITPCGICRQVINEEECLGGAPITIIMDSYNDERIMIVTGIKNLLPFAFGPGSMK